MAHVNIDNIRGRWQGVRDDIEEMFELLQPFQAAVEVQHQPEQQQVQDEDPEQIQDGDLEQVQDGDLEDLNMDVEVEQFEQQQQFEGQPEQQPDPPQPVQPEARQQMLPRRGEAVPVWRPRPVRCRQHHRMHMDGQRDANRCQWNLAAGI